MKIRFICTTVSSARDLNGNCYHFGRIISTKTGRALVVGHLGGESNLAHLLRSKLKVDWSALHSETSTLPKRQWQRMFKNVEGDSNFEHEVTRKMLSELEKA